MVNVERALRGDKVALGRLVTRVENRMLERDKASRLFNAYTGRAQVIGITGPPGAGKSTLVNELIRVYRGQGKSLCVMAVDPSSSLTGGAVLGDRLRMREGWDAPEVFIRSLANRGSVGGLTDTIDELVTLFDACGKEIIILETVGIGQAEIRVTLSADTTILVTVPGLGDEVQILKAGILEVCDIIAVNKADRPDAGTTTADLRMAMAERQRDGWSTPVLETIATTGEGVAELVQAIENHAQHLSDTGKRRAKIIDKTRQIVLHLIEKQLLENFLSKPQVGEVLENLLQDVADRRIELFDAMAKLQALQ